MTDEDWQALCQRCSALIIHELPEGTVMVLFLGRLTEGRGELRSNFERPEDAKNVIDILHQQLADRDPAVGAIRHEHKTN